MTLVVTPGAADAVSYALLEDALSRAAIDVRGATFVALDDAEKQEQLLAMGASDIDAALLSSGRQVGIKLSADQSLEQPRDGETTIAPSLRLANILQAFYLADRLSLGEIGTPVADTSNIKRDKVGPIETEYFDRGAGVTATLSAYNTLPAWVRGLLEAVLSPTDSLQWSSSRVRRTT